MNVPPSLRPLSGRLGAALLCAAVLPCCRGPQEPVTRRAATADAGAVARPATPRAGDAAVPDGPTGSIAGVVRINGPLPAPVPIPVDADTARRPGCAEAAQNWYARLYPVSQPGPLPWAVVTADARSQAAPTRRNRYANYRDCHIEPPVLVMSLADRLLLHAETDQHHLPKVDGMGSTIAQLLQRTEDQEKFILRPGRYILHSVNFPLWMQTPLLVTPNWFYDQTDRAGAYRITRVPVGRVTVHAWYPNAREATATVEVRAGETVTQDFLLTPVPSDQIAPRQPLTAPDAGPVIP